MLNWTATDPSHIDTRLESRAITFENPTGARGSGGSAGGGRKGAPMRNLAPGEDVALADVEGPGTVRHVWMTVGLAPPEILRSLVLEVYYEGSAEPSIAVPLTDFFGCPHGRPVEYASALTVIQEGRGYNSYVPMPFRRHLRVVFRNASPEHVTLYYQFDLTLERDLAPEAGYLHVPFRRENPTTMGRDFTIVDGLGGAGRFLGCVVGVRVIDGGMWYGEGEVKMYLDGDDGLPTICGTGLEDYVGSAWGLGAHATPFAGAPLVVAPPAPTDAPPGLVGMAAPVPRFVGFYRWHLLDPVVFSTELRVTIQQIGTTVFAEGQEDAYRTFAESHPAAGMGWIEGLVPGLAALGLHERVDDYCAAAFVYCIEPQAVPPVDVEAAIADIERRDYEVPHPMEAMRHLVAPIVEDHAVG